MKKNTIKVFILALALAGSTSVLAQKRNETRFKTNYARLKERADEVGKKHAAEYKRALELAKQNNWPVTYTDDAQNIISLVRVDANGVPLYYSTSNHKATEHTASFAESMAYFNYGSTLTSRVNEIQPGGSMGLNLAGQGMHVAMWDGNYPLTTHQDFYGRIEDVLDGSNAAVALHPTHVMGTIMGSGASTSVARGMAYEALSAVADFDNDAEEMYNNAGLYILSNHSYGYGTAYLNQYPSIRGSYVEESFQVDEMMFLAPYYQPVIAAGNDGNGNYDRLSDRGVSKNGINVAAMHEMPHTSPDEVAVIADFSNWGPTNDRRIKPDIADKGVDVISSSNASATAYTSLDGTSMATPGVTGSLVLIQQHYNNLHPSPIQGEKNFMLSSSLRALLTHSADDAGSVGPDPIFGWGVINAKRMVEILNNDGDTSLLQEVVLEPGQTYEIQVQASGAEQLRATIAWTDPAYTNYPVTSATSVLVNDLDLRIQQGTSTALRPWRLATSNSSPAVKGDNAIDNMERVEVDNASGYYTIRVTHKGNTLVNPEGSPQQVFSLVVSGITGGVSAVETNSKKIFAMYPNPAKDVVNINFTQGVEQNANAVIYDIQGRQVISAALKDINSQVNISGLTKGVYLVNITNGAVKQTEKLVIE